MSIDKMILKSVSVDEYGIQLKFDGFEYSVYMPIVDFTKYESVDNNLLHQILITKSKHIPKECYRIICWYLYVYYKIKYNGLHGVNGMVD